MWCKQIGDKNHGYYSPSWISRSSRFLLSRSYYCYFSVLKFIKNVHLLRRIQILTANEKKWDEKTLWCLISWREVVNCLLPRSVTDYKSPVGWKSYFLGQFLVLFRMGYVRLLETKKLAEISFLNPEFWNQLSQKSPTFSCSPFRAKISTFSPALPTIWPAENNLLPRLLMAGKSKLLWSSSLSVSTGSREERSLVPEIKIKLVGIKKRGK